MPQDKLRPWFFTSILPSSNNWNRRLYIYIYMIDGHLQLTNHHPHMYSTHHVYKYIHPYRFSSPINQQLLAQVWCWWHWHAGLAGKLVQSQVKLHEEREISKHWHDFFVGVDRKMIANMQNCRAIHKDGGIFSENAHAMWFIWTHSLSLSLCISLRSLFGGQVKS